MAAIAPTAQAGIVLYTADGVPIPLGEGVWQSARGSRRGEAFVLNPAPFMGEPADDQSYFTTLTPTPGTPVTYALQAAFSDLVGFVHVVNIDVAGTGKRILLHQLKILCAAVGAAATSVELLVKTDKLPRLPTAGFTALIPNNCRSGSAVGSIAQVYIPNAAGLTMPAASAGARTLDRGRVRYSIPIAGDEFVLNFGGIDGVAGIAPAAAVAGKFPEQMAPVSIDPGHSATIYMWQPGITTTAPTFELALGHIER